MKGGYTVYMRQSNDIFQIYLTIKVNLRKTYCMVNKFIIKKSLFHRMIHEILA